MGCAINGPLIVSGKSADGRWREYIGGNHAMTEIRDKPDRRGKKFIVIFVYKIKKAIEIAFILVGYYLLRPRSFTSSLYLTISLFIR